MDVGGEISFEDIWAKHDAILLATGVYKARDVLPNCGLTGIVPALEYLTASNQKSLGDKVEAFDNGALNAEQRCCGNRWRRYGNGLRANRNPSES